MGCNNIEIRKSESVAKSQFLFREFHDKILWILKIYLKSNFVRGFHKKNSQIFKILKNFTKIKNFKHKYLKFWSFINLSWGHARSHKKLGPDRFSRFDVYWIQINRHTLTDNLNIDVMDKYHNRKKQNSNLNHWC